MYRYGPSKFIPILVCLDMTTAATEFSGGLPRAHLFCGDRLEVGGVCVKLCEVCFNVGLAEIYVSCCSYVSNEMVGKRKFGKDGRFPPC